MRLRTIPSAHPGVVPRHGKGDRMVPPASLTIHGIDHFRGSREPPKSAHFHLGLPRVSTAAGPPTVILDPLGDYSLRESAGFIDAWHEAPSEGNKSDGHLHLAFLTDREWAPAGVCLTQGDSGRVAGTVYGDAPVDAVRAQTTRILSLDVDGREWPEVANRDPVVARLQTMFPGFRPVNWSNAYEAAAWCLISSRLAMRQAQTVKERMCRELSALDELPTSEPRLLSAVATAYGLSREPDITKLTEIAEQWRPYRMWVAVCLRRMLSGGAGMMHSRAAG